MEEPQIEVLAALICDDVRKEISGKDIIIGVYVGDILVANFPANVLFCLWLLLKFSGAGTLKMKFRVMGADDSQLAYFDGDVEIHRGDANGTLPLPRVPVTLGKEMSLRFEWQLGDGEWQTLVSKEVKLQRAIPSEV